MFDLKFVVVLDFEALPFMVPLEEHLVPIHHWRQAVRRDSVELHVAVPSVQRSFNPIFRFEFFCFVVFFYFLVPPSLLIQKLFGLPVSTMFIVELQV